MVEPNYLRGIRDPKQVFSKMSFLGVALEPPNSQPGSWIGAGKAIYDPDAREFLLTARPRMAEGNVRGFAANIYRSKDGLHFDLLASITKEEASSLSGHSIHSIEGTQLLKNPESGAWHLYVSVDTGEDFIWGGLYWETLLLTADSLHGTWKSEGIVLPNNENYDAHQARDPTIDMIDDRWIALYKAKDSSRKERPALAVSSDGIDFEKKGVLKIDGKGQLAFLSGTIFATEAGPLFMGIRKELADSRRRDPRIIYADQYAVGHGGGPMPRFVGYRIDEGTMNLSVIFEAPWEPKSPFEHKEHPLLGYSSLVFDPLESRLLVYLEAIDPKLSTAIGINSTVERLLIYESRP